MTRKLGFFTIDVEEYYHIIDVRGTPQVEDWDRLPSRVEYGMDKLFELLDVHGVKASLFFLGYIAEKHPQLVKKAVALGHEIASHGMYHLEVTKQTRKEFIADARQSRMILEDTCGKPVIGYRSAGFSINQSTPWFFESLVQAGYLYDSSVVPNRRHQKRLPPIADVPAQISTPSGRIMEFPICMADFLGMQLNMFGGGYLRFFPKNIIAIMAHRTIARRPLLTYIHPREMDPGHPHIPMNLYRKFKSYVNLKSVPDKLELLLNICSFQRLGDYYQENKDEI